MRRALGFLTPFFGAREPSAGALVWFPALGAAIGLAVGGLWWLAAHAWPAALAAAVAVGADALLTGFLHLDGVADAGDGLLPPLERAKRFEVMTDPHVGAFGVVSVVVVLLLRFGAFASMAATPLVIGGLWCGSRAAMAVLVGSPSLRPGGMASAFGSASDVAPLAWRWRATVPIAGLGVLGAFGLAALGRGVHGVVAIGAEALGVGAVVWLARRRLGVITGDVIGAAGVVGETAGLMMLAARW